MPAASKYYRLGEMIDVVETAYLAAGVERRVAKALAHEAVKALSHHYQAERFYMPGPDQLNKLPPEKNKKTGSIADLLTF